MPSLTVGILAKNEARRIAACIAAVRFADQVLVVDSGSADDTVAVARAAGADVVVEADWQGFAEQRNRLLAHARGDWVFFVDADEIVSPQLAASVRATVAAGVPVVGTVRWVQVAFGRRLRWFLGQAEIDRLFPRAQLLRYEGLVHEQAQLATPLPRVLQRGPLDHHSRETVGDSLHKLRQYALLGAAKRAAQGRRGGVLRGMAASLAVFVRLYLLRLGFTGGGPGLLFCSFVALEAFYRYAALHYDRAELRGDVGR